MSKRTGRKRNNTKHKKEESVTVLNEFEDMVDLGKFEEMKRPQLQALCKRYGLKASGKNTELVKRLQEHVRNNSNNNNNNNVNNSNNNAEDPALSSSSHQEIEEPKKLGNVTFEKADSHVQEVTEPKKLSNVTFEIADSQIPTDEHVHVSSSDSSSSDSPSSRVDLQAIDINGCVGPDSTKDANYQLSEEETKSKPDLSSSRILKELNYKESPSAGQNNDPKKAKIDTCTNWCVVEGLLKQENKSMWKKIYLSGGKAMISNSFGKRVPFVLEPCGLMTPKDYDDNYICRSCVRDNEVVLRCKGGSRVVHSSAMPQEPDNSEPTTKCSTPLSSSHSLLTSFSRSGSVKRKRSEDANGSVVNSSTDSDQMEKKRRKDAIVRSGSSTPASPQVRRARGEQLVLPRNLIRPWQPKKTTKTSQSVIREDTEFAKRVEEIIKNTQPGSDEEMSMIMFSKSSRIQRSPTKTTE